MSQENVEVVRRLIASFQQGVREGHLMKFDADLVSPDLEWIPGPNAALGLDDRYQGAEGFARFMRTWIEDFEDWSLGVEELHDLDDERVLALLNQSAVGKASRARVELQQAAIFELGDGRVIRIRHYLEPVDGFKAAGLRR
jgi:ketosteroid isomerase-like protein